MTPEQMEIEDLSFRLAMSQAENRALVLEVESLKEDLRKCYGGSE